MIAAEKGAIDMRIVLGIIMLLLSVTAASAQLEWPGCDGRRHGFERSGAGPDITFWPRCKEMTVEDVRTDFPEALESHEEEWRDIWNVLSRYPQRVFYYELVVGSPETDIDVSITDEGDIGEEMAFPFSPYIRIEKSLIIHVQKCTQKTIAFLSPWLPRVRRVQTYWLESPPRETHWQVGTDFPPTMVLPSAGKDGNPFAAQGHFYALPVKIEPLVPSEYQKFPECSVDK
jgi:hypothetical protein